MSNSLLKFLNDDSGKIIPFFTIIHKATTDSRFRGNDNQSILITDLNPGLKEKSASIKIKA
jgi:hypothetical protein